MARAETLFEDVARILREVAAAEVMPRWRNLGAGDIVEKTGPADLVTIADREAELALTRRLEALLPGSVTVGEEAVAADRGVLARLAAPGTVWVIDPIDGTSAFAAGEPHFALMVALVEDGRPAAGWILAPALGDPASGDMTWGGPGHGAWQARDGGRPQALPRPAVPADLRSMVGLLGRRNMTPDRRAQLAAKEPHFKALGAVECAGIDYPRLVRGEAHFALYSKTEPWDHLPGLAILAAHGYHAARHDRQPYRPTDSTGGLLIAPDAPSFTRIADVMLG